ncbi:MAG: hypothetical protein JO168_27360 [Solirubrobacterales bacterium]|nr:hypothetical protein [Solirubrobacterales bacterium]MBV9716733.1 hypothetical protein [Solirubrobacterales bacterium]
MSPTPSAAPAKDRERPTVLPGGRSAGAPQYGERLRQPPQPGGTPPPTGTRKPVPAGGAEILGTAVQAAAELAEIGLSLSARALRNALARLPKP